MMEARITIAGASRNDIEEALRLMSVRMTSVPDLARAVGAAGEAPNVVLLDLRQADRVPPAVADFTAQHRTIAVIIVAASLDATMMRDAFNAGARGFVTDVSVKELEAAIGRVVAPAVRQPGKVLAFVGAKGGVGTTTLAVNVGTAAALMAKGETLFIDLNARYGDATACLAIEPRFTVSDALENAHKLDMPFMRGLVARTSAEMDVLAAPDRPVSGSSAVLRLRTLIEFAKREYQYTVIDLPHTDDSIFDALEGVSTVFVVVSQEVTAVRNASRVVAALRQRYGQERAKIAIGRLDRHAEISVEDVEKALGLPVRAFSSDFRRALDSLNCGRPLVLDNNSRLAGEVKRFVRELAGKPQGNDSPRDSLLPKWFTGGRT